MSITPTNAIQTKTNPLALRIVLTVAFSLAIALSAQWAFPLPYSPIPITLQTLLVLLAGYTLGSRWGTLALLTYLAEGAAGLPVFAGGNARLAYMMGPTGGYLVGFVAAAALVGFLSERFPKAGRLSLLGIFVAGSGVIYLFGAGYWSTIVGMDKALTAGVYPFIAGDLTKIAVAMLVVPVVKRVKKH